MSRFHLRVLLIGILFLLCGSHGLKQIREAKLFQEKLSQAKQLLAKTSTGWNFAMGLEAHGTYREAIKIHPQPPSFILENNKADGGGLWKNPNGQYEILLNPSVSVDRMAHTLAHELQHIRDEMVADKILQQSPALQDRIHQAIQNIYKNQSALAAAEMPLETSFVIKSLFCTEYRAHTLNLALQEEGLPDFFLRNESQAMAHVRDGYIHRHGFRIEPDELKTLASQCAYRATEPNSPLQTLLKSIFPETFRSRPDAT